MIPSNQPIYIAYLPIVLPIPRSQAWNNIKYNQRSDDEPVLRYVPYFGDDDITGVDVSAYDQVPGEIELEISSELNIPIVKPEVITALEKVLNITTSQLVRAFDRSFEGKLYRER
eukprot:gene20507-26601_t